MNLSGLCIGILLHTVAYFRQVVCCHPETSGMFYYQVPALLSVKPIIKQSHLLGLVH